VRENQTQSRRSAAVNVRAVAPSVPKPEAGVEARESRGAVHPGSEPANGRLRASIRRWASPHRRLCDSHKNLKESPRTGFLVGTGVAISVPLRHCGNS
jgi:hypothetical protein